MTSTPAASVNSSNKKSNAGLSRTAMIAISVVPLLVLFGLTALFRWTDLDLTLAGKFYDAERGIWTGNHSDLWLFVYKYFTWPGMLLGVAGVAVAVGSIFWAPLRSSRSAGMFFALMLALGPGLLVNGVFKPYWPRPRPKHVVDFGGQEAFISVLSCSPTSDSKSFPSGHASMGFMLIAPAFLLLRRRPSWAIGFFALGVTMGCILGVARMAQGCHFASDVLWSGGMLYFTGLALVLAEHALRRWQNRAREKSEHNGSQSRGMGTFQLADQRHAA